MLSIIIASFLATTAVANPIAFVGRADSDCTTILSGYLAADISGQYFVVL
jgi:hypothetical protein